MTLGPPDDLDRRSLSLLGLDPGAVWFRFYAAKHPDPFGFNRNATSRFSAPGDTPPDRRFGLIYLGASFKVAFAETLVRDQSADQPSPIVEEARFATTDCAEMALRRPLRLVDLRGDARIRLNIPSNVAGARHHALARRWSLAFHGHPERPDGVIYASRLNGETCLAVYERAIADGLQLRARPRRLTAYPAELAAAVDAFNVALV